MSKLNVVKFHEKNEKQTSIIDSPIFIFSILLSILSNSVSAESMISHSSLTLAIHHIKAIKIIFKEIEEMEKLQKLIIKNEDSRT